jgi:hypothetical protein
MEPKSVYYSFSNPTGKNKKALGLSDDSLDGCERFILNPQNTRSRDRCNKDSKASIPVDNLM